MKLLLYLLLSLSAVAGDVMVTNTNIIVYISPKGKGTQTVYSVTMGTNLLVKSVNVGPESYRQYDWKQTAIVRTNK